MFPSRGAEVSLEISRNGYCQPSGHTRSDYAEGAVCSVLSKGCARIRRLCPRAAAAHLQMGGTVVSAIASKQQRITPMTAHTKLPSTPSVTPEARAESQSPASTKEAKVAGPAVYWGDRLALKFWIICFGLMLTMHLVEALHRLVFLMMSHSPTR